MEHLPSGRYRARYRGPDGRRYTAPISFVTLRDARAWLSIQQADIIRKAWTPSEAAKRPTESFGTYAETWLAERDLAPRTREHYRKLLDQHLLPEFGELELSGIAADRVRSWHARMGDGTPTLRAHCYGLLRTIMGTACGDGKAPLNPCNIKGAGSAKRKVIIRPATKEELDTITAEMPERYQALIPLASWVALRFGEATELRRKDFVLDPDRGKGIVRVRRGVVRTDQGRIVRQPKTDAGVRDVSIPPHLVGVLAEHLARYVGPEPEALVFPAKGGQHLASSTLSRWYYKARASAGRSDLRFHDLRHSGGTMAAQTGATLAELMGRLGHSSPQAAMRYQHVAEGRDEQIARELSRRAGESITGGESAGATET